MKRIFDFEFQSYCWINDEEVEPVKLADVLVIDVPDDLTDSMEIFRFAKNRFLEMEKEKNNIQIDVTSIRELTQSEALERTKHWKTPLDLTGI